jgi:hypothetical protein
MIVFAPTSPKLVVLLRQLTRGPSMFFAAVFEDIKASLRNQLFPERCIEYWYQVGKTILFTTAIAF